MEPRPCEYDDGCRQNVGGYHKWVPRWKAGYLLGWGHQQLLNERDANYGYPVAIIEDAKTREVVYKAGVRFTDTRAPDPVTADLLEALEDLYARVAGECGCSLYRDESDADFNLDQRIRAALAKAAQREG